MILINTLGIQDSGGITVLDKVLNECSQDKSNKYLIVCNNKININVLYNYYKDTSHFNFEFFNIKNIIYRLYVENIVFRKLHKNYNIELIYNFSGSAQFYLKIPQLIKVHDLSYFSKSVDHEFFFKHEYFKWFLEVLFKRLIFSRMINNSDYIEMQSEHVKEYISDFVDISNKKLFFKSDINVNEEDFLSPVAMDFKKTLKLIYIIGPHFESTHKNFDVFIQALLILKDQSVDFEIVITLTKEELSRSSLWNRSLDAHTTFLGYTPKTDLMKKFESNTILISTSIIETLGLHVIEAIQNGVVVIVPNEKYSLSVYGPCVLTYETFEPKTLVNAIKKIKCFSYCEVKSMVMKNKEFLITSEKLKFHHIVEVFNIILKK